MMMALVVVLLFSQVMGTPIANGNLVISSGVTEFPPLPDDVKATPLDDRWELLYYDVIVAGNDYVIRGEIRNTSAEPLETPTLLMTFSNGAQMDAVADIAFVGSGGRAPFSTAINGDEVTKGLNTSQLIDFATCSSSQVIPNLLPKWEFSDVKISWNPEDTTAQVSGTVTNQGQDLNRLSPTMFGFSANGHYAGAIDYWDAPTTFFNGDSYNFDMDANVTTYHTDLPFTGAGRELTFVLFMSKEIGAWASCA